MKTIGERIRQAREALKISGESLSKKVGYSHQSGIGNLESRATGRGGNKIAAIADALHVPVDWLLRGPDNPNVPFLPGMDIGIAIPSTEIGEPSLTPVRPINTGPVVGSAYDPWTLEAIRIMTGLQEHEKQGAIANLRTYVHNLGPPRDGQTLSMAA
jgi:transcriptional regulator with XRE-family HTH domain